MAKFNLKPLEQNEITQYSHNNTFVWKSQLDIIHLYIVLNRIMVDLSNPQFINTTVDEIAYKNFHKHYNFSKYIEIKLFKKIECSINCNVNLYILKNQLLVHFKFYLFKKKNLQNFVLKRTYVDFNHKFYENYIKILYSNNVNELIKVDY